MKNTKDLLPGNAVIASGMISYAGSFTPDYRKVIEQDWRDYMLKEQKDVPYTKDITMKLFMQEEMKL